MYHNLYLNPTLLYHIWINGDLSSYYKFINIIYRSNDNIINNLNNITTYDSLSSSILLKTIPNNSFKYLKITEKPDKMYKTLPQLLKIYEHPIFDDTIEAIQLSKIILYNPYIMEIPITDEKLIEAERLEHPKYLVARVKVDNNFKRTNRTNNNNMSIFHIINKFQLYLGKCWESSWTHIYDEWWEWKILISNRTEIYHNKQIYDINYINGLTTCTIHPLINYGYDICKNSYVWHLAQALVASCASVH